jgi:hypothetical protein
MVDGKTVIIALAGGRTFANLQENPNAVYMIIEKGASILDWNGVGSILGKSMSLQGHS